MTMKKKAIEAYRKKLNSSITWGGVYRGTVIEEIEAPGWPVDLFKIALATQFCI